MANSIFSAEEQMTTPCSRRSFLGRTVTLAAGATFAAPALLRARDLNSKLNIAVVATGGRGGANLSSVSSENIIALCDVFEPALLRAAEKYPQARKTSDFRRLFDHADEFDALVVSTCEHTHAFATLAALQLGK